MKILIFGAGLGGKSYAKYLEKFTQHELVGFVDNNMELFVGGEVMHPNDIKKCDYDKIVVTALGLNYINEIRDQLKNLSIPDDKIVYLGENKDLKFKVLSSINCYDENTDPRVVWLRAFADYIYKEEIEGNVAECGVNRGDFAEYINKYFYDKKLYLFDTFTGFDDRDLLTEHGLNNEAFEQGVYNDKACFSDNDVAYVKSRLPHLEQCEIHKGFFPDSAEGVDDKFCFVNLDMDLYQPMLAGLEFFYPRMVNNGVILLHDYFHPELPGVKQAVFDYEKTHNMKLKKVSIADYCSIAVIK